MADQINKNLEQVSPMYIVMGPQCWGKGITPENALANCRKQYGPGMKDYTVYRVHPDTTVDDMGMFSYPIGPNGERGGYYRPNMLKRVRDGKTVKGEAS